MSVLCVATMRDTVRTVECRTLTPRGGGGGGGGGRRERKRQAAELISIPKNLKRSIAQELWVIEKLSFNFSK